MNGISNSESQEVAFKSAWMSSSGILPEGKAILQDPSELLQTKTSFIDSKNIALSLIKLASGILVIPNEKREAQVINIEGVLTYDQFIGQVEKHKLLTN